MDSHYIYMIRYLYDSLAEARQIMEKRRLPRADFTRQLVRASRTRAPKSADARPSDPGGAASRPAAERLVVGSMSSPDGQLDLREFLRRLENRLKICHLTAHAAAIRAGLSPSQIGTMRRQYELGQQHGVSIRTVAKLAAALGTTPEWLLSGTGPEEAPQTVAQETPQQTFREASQKASQETTQQTPRETPQQTHQETSHRNPQETRQQTPRHSAQPVGLRLAGSVAAGVWVEPAAGNIGSRLAVIPADPRYPAEHQSAFEVRDTSIDRVARPGDYLIVVDRHAAQLPLRTGDLVIVTQQKSDLQEITARRLTTETTHGPHGCRLDFESSDPRSRHPLVHIRDMRDDHPSLSIGGVVVSVWRPLLLTR